MRDNSFDKSVFINCPFDEQFEPILQAILFAVVFLGMTPRLASESHDSGENRLSKIQSLIESSRFSVHDLSRCQAKKKGEHFRLNMPFELGLDYGCRQFCEGKSTKRFMVLEEQKYRYQAALSDISGTDIKSYGSDIQQAPQKAQKLVRDWLVSEARVPSVGTARLRGMYLEFQEWYWEKKRSEGADEDDILEYPTSEVLQEMFVWRDRLS